MVSSKKKINVVNWFFNSVGLECDAVNIEVTGSNPV
jgi:hypothetical protein